MKAGKLDAAVNMQALAPSVDLPLHALFGAEWPEVNNRYLYSPRHGHWVLCAEPNPDYAPQAGGRGSSL